MPLSCPQVGHHLPQKVPLPVMLFITFWLGVLVTYAEPAIAAIRPLAALIDPQSEPYLYYILNQKQEITVSVGLGTSVCVLIWGKAGVATGRHAHQQTVELCCIANSVHVAAHSPSPAAIAWSPCPAHLPAPVLLHRCCLLGSVWALLLCWGC